MAWQAQSLLIGYPDTDLRQRLPLLRAVAATVPRPVGRPLSAFIDHADSTADTALAADYVATFDHHKRFSLYLTYFTHGDTRTRGMALLRLKRTYRGTGLDLGEHELPDHLSVLLEFAATQPEPGRSLLLRHRAGLELLRLGLTETASPWAAIVDSISATLPTLSRHESDRVLRLAAQGPPEEAVGLTPYAPPNHPPHGGHR
ncbi:nitrate reductase molybdenum cofactor assembly chaperone [Nocardia otitidiscaviarum]|nr:nitrate reductase molybdenum cofactor assembly chaperone [Nocardia otitidiscaviarum]